MLDFLHINDQNIPANCDGRTAAAFMLLLPTTGRSEDLKPQIRRLTS